MPRLQKWTTYSAAVTPDSKVAGAAQEFVNYLTSAQAKPVYLSKGFIGID